MTYGEQQILFYLGKMSEYLGGGEYVRFLNELEKEDSIIQGIERRVANVASWQTKKFETIYAFRLYRLAIYCLVRDIKPNVYLETGVLHGLSSAFVLGAMAENNHGKLISIDLPSYENTGVANTDGYNYTLPKGMEPGWLIPENLRSRWKLNIGPSSTVLPRFVELHGDVDIFCHDSEHTYETMWFELTLAWEILKEGGVLICDNIESCAAFHDFCRRIGRIPLIVPNMDNRPYHQPGFGIVKK